MTHWRLQLSTRQMPPTRMRLLVPAVGDQRLYAASNTSARSTSRIGNGWGFWHDVETQLANAPRALWSSRAPLALIATIIFLLSCVWITYAFVGTQLLAMRHVGKQMTG